MGEEEASVLTEEEVEGVREVAKRIAEQPEVRQERIEKLKRALETSSYNVTGDDVAKKLIGRIITDKIR
jgi:anti-sigma28 factor (negative regulator of flagellin synthesis)